MIMDVVALREFYASRLGQAAEASVTASLSAMWQQSHGERFLGLGYPVPWLDRFSPDCERTLCMMPASQGALQWPSADHAATALTYDDELPLRDGSIDRILMVHFLEHAENADECIAEAFRILSPGGVLMIVVPNRTGVWARFENTPFGTGKPYTRRQLNRLLRNNQFTPDTWSDALHFAPSSRDFILKFRRGIERFGRRIFPAFAGSICVSASKQLYQGVPVTNRARRRVAVPVFAPQGTSRLGKSKFEKRYGSEKVVHFDKP